MNDHEGLLALGNGSRAYGNAWEPSFGRVFSLTALPLQMEFDDGRRHVGVGFEDPVRRELWWVDWR